MSPVSILSNISLGDGPTNNATSTVGEPTTAAAGNHMFMTGNWYASQSTDGGTNWKHVDPFTALPSAAGGFCCDQVVLYDARRRLWIWILQYTRRNGANVFRLAAVHDGDFGNPGAWYWWDIAPTTVDGSWTQLWFDYPDAAVTADNLFVTFNVFNNVGIGQWQRAVVMRFPLATIDNRGTLIFNAWSTTQNGSIRLTQGAARTMYFASHNSSQQVRLFSWADGQNSVNWWDINVTASSDAISSNAPNNVNWLARTDRRITGACIGNGTITLMWTAGSGANRPHPYCRVVQIAEASKQVTAQPDIWSSTRSWAYPAACTNSAGVLGFTAFYGGEDRNPGHIVGVREDNGTWSTAYSKLGSHSPDEPKWGDYLSCRQHAPSAETWVASGYTLEGGATRTDILPRLVRFSRV
ncbi:UNVERIFIED_ORG: hypothetical protein J2X79_004237 [Arthrobacter globiformis]|nr:hypothetical protein [Arthrobacter globiformis]